MPKTQRKEQNKNPGDPLCRLENPDAAGIDVGAEELVVAVPPDRCAKPVRTFPTFTADLHALRDWLLECGIKTVALESTSNYWIPIYQILEDSGLKVCLINARHIKSINRKKTDVNDAQWLQQLHQAGLLRASFRPDREITPLRYVMRHRAAMVMDASRQIQLMQKALTECNLSLHHVLSDLDGESGLRIMEAILAGERDPQVLASLRDHRCRTPLAKVLKALEGDYRTEYLFVLGQCLNHWKQIRNAIAECDQQIEQILAAICIPETTVPQPGQVGNYRKSAKNPIRWDVFKEAWRFYGVDLAAVPGISSSTLAVLMSELGTGAQIKEAFPSAKHFASWLGLCPENRISGGKVLTAKTRRNACRLAAALRMAAQTLGHSKSALGDLCRRLKGRLGKAEGITAMAHKLARILYSMILTRQPYEEAKALALTPAKKQRRIHRLLAEAKRLGFILTPTETPA